MENIIHNLLWKQQMLFANKFIRYNALKDCFSDLTIQLEAPVTPKTNKQTKPHHTHTPHNTGLE